MDKFKIVFRCLKSPDPSTGLEGFFVNELYEGRSFNGLFELTPDWGKGKPTVLIEKNSFERYFEVIDRELLSKAEKTSKVID